MSSNWENKLFHFEAEPPAAAWNAIAAGLDEQQAQYPKKLYHYTEQPPDTAWAGIEAQLQQPPSAKVMALPAKRNAVRYAAAAAILIFIAGIAYFTSGTGEQPVAGATINNSLLNNVPAAPPVKREIKHFNVPPQPSDASKGSLAVKEKRIPKYTIASNNQSGLVSRKQSQINLPEEPSFATGLDVVPQEKNIIDTDRADRYMIATPADGQPVRLPKKVYSAFACPEDDPNHQACELQLTLLQQKMSSSLTTDFAHFLDLLKNLQENSK